MYSYTPQGPGELGFKKGDFLYVTGQENSTEWYEAYDPPSNSLGMVPVSYFEVVSRKDAISTIPLHTAAASAAAHGHSRSNSVATTTTQSTMVPAQMAGASRPPQAQALSPSTAQKAFASKTGHAQLYGVVLYDFIAERSDELQANAGESIVIIAKSNDEWFVAKPIGRLGGPGLIPISFIEVRHIGSNRPVDDLTEALKNANVPRVEEWKRLAAEYKASSIPLGKIEDTSVTQQLKNLNMNNSSSEPAYVVSANVERYAFDNERYWYLVVAKLSNGKFRNLCRYYQDFYDFQITLLDEFPDEAGRTGKERLLPYMPGPLTYVNDSISSQRRANLDDYVQALFELPDYISASATVQQLFAIRAGDIETNNPSSAMPQPPVRNSAIESQISPVSSNTLSVSNPSRSSISVDQHQVHQQQQQQKLQQQHAHERVQHEFYSEQQQQQQQHQQHQQQDQYTSQSEQQPSQTESFADTQGQVPQSPTSATSQKSPGSSVPTHDRSIQDSTDPEAQEQQKQQEQSDIQVSSASVADNGVSSSKVTEVAPQIPEAYVKIKVFHEDDLIALRVSNHISLEDLAKRITERLEIANMVLLHKDDVNGKLTELKNTDDFRIALGTKQKLVLCAK